MNNKIKIFSIPILSLTLFSPLISCSNSYEVPGVETKQIGGNYPVYQTNFFREDYFDDILERKGFSRDKEFADWMNSKFFNNEKAVTVPMDKMTGCLSFNFINQNGKHMYGRNFDIGENTPAVATFTKTPNGYKYYSTSTYSFFTNQKNPNNSLIKKLCATASYVPLDGMNEKGLCVSMNNVSYYRNTFDGYTNQEIEGRVNMTCSLLFKYILQTCENVQEAINLINTINIHDDLQSSSMSMHFQIVDRTGSSVIVEFDHTHNSETKLVFPRTGENFQINENFTQWNADWANVESNNDYQRYNMIHGWLKPSNGVLNDSFAMERLKILGIFFDKSWCLLFNLDDLELELVWYDSISKPHSFKFDFNIFN